MQNVSLARFDLPPNLGEVDAVVYVEPKPRLS